MNIVKKPDYKTFCYQNNDNILFFYYNSNHPINVKNMKFEVGRLRIFSKDNRVFECQISSNQHLNSYQDWNQAFFNKLFHGFALFQLERSEDEHDNSIELLIRDHFQLEEEIYLLRAKLNQEFPHDIMDDIWITFARFNAEKVRSIQTSIKNNQELRGKADGELSGLIDLQERKEEEKRKLKGQLSALYRQKEAKLAQFQNYKPFKFDRQDSASVEMSDYKGSMAGSLFQQSQQFNYNS